MPTAAATRCGADNKPSDGASYPLAARLQHRPNHRPRKAGNAVAPQDAQVEWPQATVIAVRADMSTPLSRLRNVAEVAVRLLREMEAFLRSHRANN